MNIKDQIRKRIETADGEEIFFISDFAHDGNDVFISRVLSELVAEGLVARIGNGVFYKPVKTRFGDLAPGYETIVKAIARRDKAEIMPTGPTAENMLGLSTQVPMNYVYLTSGSARKINLDNVTVTFKRCVPKNFAYRGRFFPILIQAMKSIGQRDITQWHISRIEQLLREYPEPETYSHDLALAPIWIKKILRQLNKCSG